MKLQDKRWKKQKPRGVEAQSHPWAATATKRISVDRSTKRDPYPQQWGMHLAHLALTQLCYWRLWGNVLSLMFFMKLNSASHLGKEACCHRGRVWPISLQVCVCFMYINLCTHRWQHLPVPSRTVHPIPATGVKKKKKKKPGVLQLCFSPYIFGLRRHEQIPLIAQQGDVIARE